MAEIMHSVGERMNMNIKRYHGRNLCGDGIVLSLNCRGDYTNPHMTKWPSTPKSQLTAE